MALMTTTEVKAFLRESSSTYDTLIGIYIPLIEEDICSYLNNWFRDRVIFVHANSGLAFSRGNTATSSTQPDYITDDNQYFSTIGFSAGMDVVISGGSNFGIYTIKTLTSAVMTITDTGKFIDQDQDASYHNVGPIEIARIIWPAWIKPIAAKMIWHQIAQNKPNGAASESIDDYSVSYVNGRAYPQQLLSGLDKYRYARTC